MSTTTTPSTAIKLAQITFAVIFCLTSAGVIFGFAALKPVLVEEGIYADLCFPGERERDTDGKWKVCLDQDTRLNLMFTFATVLTNVVCLPIGYTLDRLGPRKTSIIGSVLFALGNFMFGWGYRSSWFDAYIVGFILLGIGGPLIFLPSFHLSNAFPAYSGVVLAAVTGAFDASSVPFVLYRLIYDKTNGALNVRLFFWGYLIVPVIIILEQLLLAPATTYQRVVAGAPEAESIESHPTTHGTLAPEPAPSTVGSDYEVAVAASAFSRIHYGDDHDDDEGMIKTHAPKDNLTGVLYGMTAAEQIKTKWFVLLTLFVCIHMARINFYILSCDSQLVSFTHNAALAESLTTLFTILLPAGGAIGIPFVGLLLDRRPFIDAIKVLMLFGFCFGILGITPAATPQIIGIAFFVLFRPLMYTAVSDAFAKVFGFQTFGTVYGLAMTLSGCVGLINAPLDVLVKTKLNGNFLPIDIAFIVAGVAICSALLYIIWKQTRSAAIRLE